MKRLILLAAFVFALPAHGQTRWNYFPYLPTGGCNQVFRTEGKGWLANKKVKYKFGVYCSRDDRHKAWEQELAGVQEIKGKSVIYIPKQKMVDGSTFGGGYFCTYPENNTWRKWGATTQCTKEGWGKV